jgi:hypothetical protein
MNRFGVCRIVDISKECEKPSKIRLSQNFECDVLQLLSALICVRGVNDVMQTEMHLPKPLTSDYSAFEGNMSFEILKDINYPVVVKCRKN